MMRGAPVTTACLGIVVATSTALSQSLLTLVLDKNPNTLTSLLRPLLTSFPSMPHAPSGWSYLCLLVFVFQLRHLERLWGSARFLTLLGVASVLGRVGAQLAVFGSTPISEATRLSHLLALVIPVSALATRYQTDMPALERVPLLFLKKVAISEKILAFAIAFCLIFFSPSSSRILSSNHPHASVRPVSIAIHVLLALSGVVLGYLSRPPASRRQRRSLFVQVLDRIAQIVSRPLVDYVIAPLMSPLAGPTSSIEHIVPARLQQAQRATRAVGGHAVGNLLGGDQDLHDGIPNEAWERILREQQALNAATPTSPNVGNTRRQFPPYRQREEFTAPEVDPLKLQLLKDLQLGASDDKIREALVVSGGDVDAAAAYLLSHEQ